VKVLHWVVVGPTVVDVKHEPLEQFMALEKKHVPEYDPHSKTDHEAEYDPHSKRDREAEFDPHSKRDREAEYDPHSKTDHEAEYDPNSMRNHEAEYDLKFTILPQHRLPHHLHQV
jgi:hypothetical protein